MLWLWKQRQSLSHWGSSRHHWIHWGCPSRWLKWKGRLMSLWTYSNLLCTFVEGTLKLELFFKLYIVCEAYASVGTRLYIHIQDLQWQGLPLVSPSGDKSLPIFLFEGKIFVPAGDLIRAGLDPRVMVGCAGGYILIATGFYRFYHYINIESVLSLKSAQALHRSDFLIHIRQPLKTRNKKKIHI